MGNYICQNQEAHIQTDIYSLVYACDTSGKYSGRRELIDHSIQNESFKKKLDEFAKKLNENQGMFRDHSLNIEPVILKAINSEQQLYCQFKRPYIFLLNGKLENNYKIFDSETVVSDIIVKDKVMQYFGIFLCFLAEHQNLIRSLLPIQPNGYGLYAAYCYEEQERKIVFFDDYILCCKETPIFTQPVKREIMWPCLIEKAWLKLKGLVGNRIVKTTPQYPFQVFLKLPIRTFSLQINDPQNTKSIVLRYLLKMNPDRSFFFGSRKDPVYNIGLQPKEFYYLLGAKELEGNWLYYLHNPLGDFKFRGKHEYLSSGIKTEIKGLFNKDIAPGNFVLDSEQLHKQMGSFSVIYYQPALSPQRRKLALINNEDRFIEFQLTEDCNFTLIFQQQSAIQKPSYSPITYQVVSLNRNKIIAGTQNNEGCFGVKTAFLVDDSIDKCSRGNYLLRIKKKNCSPVSGGIQCELVSVCKENIIFDFLKEQKLNQQWQQFLLEEGRRQLQKHSSKRNHEIDYIVHWIGDLVLVYIAKGNTRANYLSIEVYFPQIINLECLTHPKLRKGEYYALKQKLSNEKRQTYILFQKIVLTELTKVGAYSIETF